MILLINDNTLEIAAASIARLGPLETDTMFNNISGAGTFVLKYSPGRLLRIVINTGLGTTATIYNNTSASGQTIATINLSGNPTFLDFDCPFSVGLTVVTVGSGTNITVIYE